MVTEHFAGTLAVGAGDERGMNIDEAPFVEKFVQSEGRFGTDSEHSVEGVGARTEMGNGAQEFKGVALVLQGIIGGGGALHLDLLRLQLKGLFGFGRQHKRSGGHKGGTQILPGDLLVIRKLFGLQNDLEILKIGAVVQL